jgi:predicted nucleic acid-binding Zn ribbon protein
VPLKAGEKIKSWIPVRSFTHTLEENYAIYDNIEILVEIEITQSNIDLLNSANDSMTDCYIYNRWIDGSVRTDDSRYPMASLPSNAVSSPTMVAPRFSEHRSVIAGCYEWMWHLGFTGHDPLVLEQSTSNDGGVGGGSNSTVPPPLSPSPAPLLKKSIPSSVDKPGIPPPTTLQATKSEDNIPSNDLIEVQKSLSASDLQMMVESHNNNDDDLKKGGAGATEELSRSVDDRFPSSTSPLSLMRRQSLRAVQQAKEVQEQQQQQRKSQERRMNGGISPIRNRLQSNIPDSDDEEEESRHLYNSNVDDLSPSRTYERRNTMFDSMDDLTLLSPSQSLHDLAVLALSPSSPGGQGNNNQQHSSNEDSNGAITDPVDSNASSALPPPPRSASAAVAASPLSPISSIHIKSRIDFIYSLDWIKSHILELNKLLDDIKGYLPDLRRKMRSEKAFRSSVLKKDPMVQPLPTNLHYQLLEIRKHCVACYEAHPKPTEIIHSLSCGALSPHQLGHKQGKLLMILLFTLVLLFTCLLLLLSDFLSFSFFFLTFLLFSSIFLLFFLDFVFFFPS